MSVAGGLHRAFEAAAKAGCDCLQIFVKNQRQWAAKRLDDEAVRAFRQAQENSGIGPIVAHASYLINLASPGDALREKSIGALQDELDRCEALGVFALVVHPGAHMGDGVESGIRRIAASIDEVHDRTRGNSARIALETTAGQGSSLGHEIRQLGEVVGAVAAPERLSICLDTCHLFAAGYDLRHADDYERMMSELGQFVGLERVCCIHTNDSKGECGSRLDRHEHITEGKIGKEGFHRLLNDPRLARVPRILETPKGEDGRGRDFDRLNLQRLRSMIEPSRQ